MREVNTLFSNTCTLISPVHQSLTEKKRTRAVAHLVCTVSYLSNMTLTSESCWVVLFFLIFETMTQSATFWSNHWEKLWVSHPSKQTGGLTVCSRDRHSVLSFCCHRGATVELRRVSEVFITTQTNWGFWTHTHMFKQRWVCVTAGAHSLSSECV